MSKSNFPIFSGIIAFTFSLFLYWATVVLTTPNLKPLTALEVTFALNPQITFGAPASIGLQTYLAAYLKRLPCPTGNLKPGISITASGSALASFLSFFELTQVGCCSVWLLYLSLLPGLISVGITAFLIRYSTELTNLFLILAWLPVLLSLLKIKRLRSMKRTR